jgi:hypothetical protein
VRIAKVSQQQCSAAGCKCWASRPQLATLLLFLPCILLLSAQVLKSPGSSGAQLEKAVAEVASTLAANTADLEAWAVKAVRWVVDGKGGRGGCSRVLRRQCCCQPSRVAAAGCNLHMKGICAVLHCQTSCPCHIECVCRKTPCSCTLCSEAYKSRGAGDDHHASLLKFCGNPLCTNLQVGRILQPPCQSAPFAT